MTAARGEGIQLRSVSGYRSAQTQAELLARSERDSGEEAALALTARPGHSEHQLGTTIDFGAGDGSAPWDGDWGTSREGRWLSENAWRYGFVLSYPKDGSPAATCYSYEPWHFRYFGRDLAREIHESGLTTRAFLWLESHPSAKAAGGDAGNATPPAQANGATAAPRCGESPGSGAPVEASSSASVSGTDLVAVSTVGPGAAVCPTAIVLGALMRRRNRAVARRAMPRTRTR